MQLEIRPYATSDESAWLECRALSFLSTAYFDDVAVAKPVYDTGIELVAVRNGTLVGLIDVAVEGSLATIETVAVHPQAARLGIGTAMLKEAKARLPSEADELDAWTRTDLAANDWYLRNGFAETFRYLHVFASAEEIQRTVTVVTEGLTPVAGFFHADIQNEAQIRASYERVYQCRRYLTSLRPTSPTSTVP